MIITTKDILDKIENEFSHAYKPFSKFKNSGELWNKCVEVIKDEDLMNKIIFANDILSVPPVEVFDRINSTISINSDFEKKALGSFWGFVFKFVFGYKNQRSKSITTNNIRTATYFYDKPEKINVIKGE
jgi:hypothetical protein